MTEVEKEIAEKNGTTSAVYGQEVNRLIRERYTMADELAILRQRDEKPEEYEAYCVYAEECKAKVKQDLDM